MKNKALKVLLIIILIHQIVSHQVDEEENHSQSSHTPQNDSQKVVALFSSVQKEVGEWLSLPRNKTLDRALWQCYVLENSTQLIGFLQDMAAVGQDFTKQHVDLMPKLFRRYKHVSNIMKCLSFLREFQNKFIEQPKKLKYLLQFLREHPAHTKRVFPQHQNYTLKGLKIGSFLKVLFEFYYVQVVSSMETLASSFMRALTLRSNIFQHYDIAYCLSLQTLGAMSEALEEISINNIYLKMPDLLRELRYLKLKDQCKDQQNRRLVANLREALEEMDMFNIMFNQYEPWVEIASEKFGHTQVRRIARQFAHMLDFRQKYVELSKKRNQDINQKKEGPASSQEL